MGPECTKKTKVVIKQEAREVVSQLMRRKTQEWRGKTIIVTMKHSSEGVICVIIYGEKPQTPARFEARREPDPEVAKSWLLRTAKAKPQDILEHLVTYK